MLEVSVQRRLRGFDLDVAFSVRSGVLGILGASGSGKSMTLRCVAGIDRPTSGRIELDGRALFDAARRIDLPPKRRKVGYLFQSYALFPNMTVAENIGCALPRAGRAERVRRLIERFQLGGLERRYPAQLSGGQQQRAAVARCLAAEPAALLLDEPFSALDAQLREQMQTELRDMLRGYPGKVILVTHDQREAYRLCDHLAVLHEGRRIAQGETARLFEQPGHVQAARLTGCRNISRARRLSGRRVLALDWGIELETEQPLEGGITAVGIRESSFTAEGENRFDVRCVDLLEELDATSARVMARGESPLWVRLPKGGQPPRALCVAPTDVLPLRGEV